VDQTAGQADHLVVVQAVLAVVMAVVVVVALATMAGVVLVQLAGVQAVVVVLATIMHHILHLYVAHQELTTVMDLWHFI
jgi:hypothetical protein